MTGASLLQELGAVLVAGTAGALLLRPLRVPGVVAYIVAGLVVGPLTGLMRVTPGVHLMSELGVALLLFLVGLEMSLERIRAVGRTAVLAGAGQMAITAAAGFGVGLVAGLDPAAAAVAGLAVSFSSTAVVVKLLDGADELGSRHGQLSLGVLLVQDVVVVVSLTVLAGLEGGGAGTARRLLGAAGGMAVLVAAAVLAARFLLPPLFRRAAAERETLFVWSLAWCFLFIVAAEGFHLSVELGAFLAGVAIAQLPAAHDLSRRVAPLTTFFLAVFFVTLGVELKPGAAAGSPGTLLALFLVALPAKGVVMAWLLARLGQDEETAVRTGITLSQTSEFSFILVGAAAAAGLAGPGLTAVVGVVGLATISASSFGILTSRRLHARLRDGGLLGWLRAAPGEIDGENASGDGRLEGHVIVVGMNPLGRTLVRRLADAGQAVLAVDTDPGKLAGLPVSTIQGAAQDPAVLAEAGLGRARLLVSALRIEDVNELLAHRCRAAGVPASIHAFDPSVVARLGEVGVDHLIFSRDDGTRRVADGLRSLGVLA